MVENTREYVVIMKKTGKIMDDFWANPSTADAKAGEKWDLRKVTVKQVYP